VEEGSSNQKATPEANKNKVRMEQAVNIIKKLIPNVVFVEQNDTAIS
jgi:hypothetical protein